MNINYFSSLVAIVVLFLIVYTGIEVAGLYVLFGIVIPYLAVIVFISGVIYRVMDWARSPVPFRIPSTCGQQKSLPWIKQGSIENPTTTGGVVLRMILEILLFRSLFRNTVCELKAGDRLSYEWEKWLWLAALAFHWSFLVVLIRHLRFFLEPVPYALQLLVSVDGFLQVGTPGIFISGIVLLAALTFLFLRRIFISRVRYISLASDFFPLFLIASIAISGILMRHFTKVDTMGIKELAIGLATFRPVIPDDIGAVFYVHMFFVCVLMAYFPFSKLMHAGGIFLSPTRNLSNNSRVHRHVNPWNPTVKVHTYEEYEDEFREKMIEAEIPVEKMIEAEIPVERKE